MLGSLRSACRSRGVTVAAVLALATAPAMAAPESPRLAATCQPSNADTLSLDHVNVAGVPPAIVNGAMAETLAIFERAGVRLSWTLTPAMRPSTDPARLVVILAPGPFPAAPPGLVGHRLDGTLGWLDFDAAGRPGQIIRLSFHEIATLARRATMMNLRVAELPDQVQAPLLGRAIGRVLAHELGHWFAGREHTKGGLMSAAFRDRDLVDFWSPQLPREWTAVGSTTLRLPFECASTVTLATSAPALAAASR